MATQADRFEALASLLASKTVAGLRLVKTVTGPSCIVKVYKDSDLGEFQVRPSGAKGDDSDGQTYFTSDQKDAFDTAKHMSEKNKGKDGLGKD